MSQRPDQDYLRNVQYKDASNLEARIALHERFSTNRYDYYLWVFDRLKLKTGERVLEIGCGPGTLWARNLHRLPHGLNVTLTDLSLGMVDEAGLNLASTPEPFNYTVADAQALPLPNNSFDVVLANHMLYHVPDKALALSEIQRVLRGGGRFYAATNGQGHMRELDELVIRHEPSVGSPILPPLDFTLENGAAEIGKWFDSVTLERYEDGLVVTDAGALAAYVLSMSRGQHLDSARLVQWIEQELEERGPIKIGKDVGFFEAM